MGTKKKKPTKSTVVANGPLSEQDQREMYIICMGTDLRAIGLELGLTDEVRLSEVLVYVKDFICAHNGEVEKGLRTELETIRLQFEMLSQKLQPKFKAGDRVAWHLPSDPEQTILGTVKGVEVTKAEKVYVHPDKTHGENRLVMQSGDIGFEKNMFDDLDGIFDERVVLDVDVETLAKQRETLRMHGIVVEQV